MEFRDLKTQYRALKTEIDAAMLAVAQSGGYIMGKPVAELEKALAEYVGVEHCVTCANGTDALSLVLMAWGIGEGDAVFVPDFTFFASGEVVSFEGATPVFVDVDAATFNLDPEKLAEAVELTLREGKLVPKAIVAVDLFGLPANYPAIRRVADQYGLKILEDGAQGFGGKIGSQRACSFGDAATTSFFPAKPLGCYGDGGAVFCNDNALAALISSIKVHGKGSEKYDNVRIGMNSRLDTLQAAILMPKLKAFIEYEFEAVNRAAGWYTERLAGLVQTPVVPDGYASSWAQYTLTLQNRQQRDALQAALKAKDIPSMVYYPKPMHAQTAFAGLHQTDRFPVTDRLCECVLSLPMHPYLTEEVVDEVCAAVKAGL